jgi:hypothetical protein
MEKEPEEGVEHRRQRLRAEASWRQEAVSAHARERCTWLRSPCRVFSARPTVSAHACERCTWLLLLTDVPATRLSVHNAVVLLRERWHRERLFTRWKHEGRVDAWRTGPCWRIVCKVDATRIGVLLHQWLSVLCAWHDAQRSLVTRSHVIRPSWLVPVV